MGSFTLIATSCSQLFSPCGMSARQHARALAESVVTACLEAHIRAMGTTPASSQTVTITGPDGLSQVSFGPTGSSQYACSVDNLAGDTAVFASGVSGAAPLSSATRLSLLDVTGPPQGLERIVPPHAIWIIGTSVTPSAKAQVECLAQVQPYPYAVAVGGAFNANGVEVAGLDNALPVPPLPTASPSYPASVYCGDGSQLKNVSITGNLEYRHKRPDLTIVHIGGAVSQDSGSRPREAPGPVFEPPQLRGSSSKLQIPAVR